MALYQVTSPDRPIMYEGDWYPNGATFDASPPEKALYHQNDKLATTLAGYLALGLVTPV